MMSCVTLSNLSPVVLETAIAVLRDRTGGVDADVEGRRTLLGLLRQVAEASSLAGLSRFLL
jgi:hypothetical protein